MQKQKPDMYVDVPFINNKGYPNCYKFSAVIFVQIFCFWTISIVLFLFTTPFCSYSKHNVSENVFCLSLQVKLTQLGPIDIF
jgi:hypothetical protein